MAGLGQSVALLEETVLATDEAGTVAADSIAGTWSVHRLTARTGVLAADGARVAIVGDAGIDVHQRENGEWIPDVALANPPIEATKRSVAIRGDVLAAGYAPTGGAGRVVVYRRGTQRWELDGEVGPPSVSSGEFGAAVAIAGEVLIVGAPAEPRPTNGTFTAKRAGGAYIFRRADAGWERRRTLRASAVTADQTLTGGEFGTAIAMVGDHAVVTAPNEASKSQTIGGDELDTSAPGAGAAYWF